MDATCQSNFGLVELGKYRYERYQQSLAGNGQFYFGPKSLLLFGAASFSYELFPSLGPEGTPDLPTISSFFGAKKVSETWTHVPEQIPPNWYHRRAPYTLNDVGSQIMSMHLEAP